MKIPLNTNQPSVEAVPYWTFIGVCNVYIQRNGESSAMFTNLLSVAADAAQNGMTDHLQTFIIPTSVFVLMMMIAKLFVDKNLLIGSHDWRRW